MILFTLLLFLLKIIVGHLHNSMALKADSFHMMTDFAALTIGYLALTYSNERGGGRGGKNRLNQVKLDIFGSSRLSNSRLMYISKNYSSPFLSSS